MKSLKEIYLENAVSDDDFIQSVVSRLYNSAYVAAKKGERACYIPVLHGPVSLSDIFQHEEILKVLKDEHEIEFKYPTSQLGYAMLYGWAPVK